MRLFAQQCEEGGSADSEHPPLPYFTNEKTGFKSDEDQLKGRTLGG